MVDPPSANDRDYYVVEDVRPSLTWIFRFRLYGETVHTRCTCMGSLHEPRPALPAPAAAAPPPFPRMGMLAPPFRSSGAARIRRTVSRGRIGPRGLGLSIAQLAAWCGFVALRDMKTGPGLPLSVVAPVLSRHAHIVADPTDRRLLQAAI